MEQMKSRRKTRKGKPFTDLSNTTPPSLPSSINPQTRSPHPLPLKSLLNHNPNADLNSKANLTTTGSPIDDNVHNAKKNKKDKIKGPSNKENPSSTLPPPPKTPSVPGDGDSVVSELTTVYSRRHTAEKRKSKGKETMEPLSCSLETRMPNLRKKIYGDGDIGLSKSCPMPCRKKQHREINASEYELPQDFIDKQRIYFAEIDAYKLEEEVASADELE
ncbi:hypothetical protein HRI_000992800 [Hibiscus trionum]|uniref:Uncharacterized protein n=1 Tax=Hibiscus trionum TaxID=183268 RepID=A0A9W7LS28_HIBTR|nr:hypothetical protein HRI_000992800 [Hibiscus trionum]